MKKLWAIILSSVFILVVVSCTDLNNINSVKQGHFTNYPNQKIGTAIDSFFENPQWESGTGISGNTEGKTLVNVKGKFLYAKEKSEAKMQFILNKETNYFTVNALEINGIPQNQYMINVLIKAIFEN